jgi:hypothetical protein
MTSAFKLAAFSAAMTVSLALGAPAAAESATAITAVNRGAPAQADAAPAPAALAQQPRLIAFEGAEELGNTMARLGLVTQVLEFSVAVGADGVPTDCAVTRRFRSATVPRQLCDVVVRHARFAPAVDAVGNPAGGTYSGRIDFRSFLTRDL